MPQNDNKTSVRAQIIRHDIWVTVAYPHFGFPSLVSVLLVEGSVLSKLKFCQSWDTAFADNV
jgi:hypothetical protein